MCKKPLACQDPGCKVRVDGGHPCRGRKAVMLQCECGVALCVPCARSQFWDRLVAKRGDYHDAAVACPKCNVMPICFTVHGTNVENPRVGYNVDPTCLAVVDAQVKELVDEVLSRPGTTTARQGTKSARYYNGALNHFRTHFGLLCDIPDPTAVDSTEFYRLVLARAEAYRQNGALLRNVPLHDLPLGPLEAIQFVEHRALDLYLHGQPVSHKCFMCLDAIAPGNTAFSMCTCAEVSVYCTSSPSTSTSPSIRVCRALTAVLRLLRGAVGRDDGSKCQIPRVS